MDFSEILARNCGEMRTFTAVYIIKVQMAEKETTYHIPVLLKPSVDGMDIRPDGTYVDVTFGGGGRGGGGFGTGGLSLRIRVGRRQQSCDAAQRRAYDGRA